MEEKARRASALHAKVAESYHIEVEHHMVEASSTPVREIMIRGVQAIKKITGWDDLVDAINVRAFLGEKPGDKEQNDASAKVKRGRITEDEET